jgi:Flp pilus assembly protein CpaB
MEAHRHFGKPATGSRSKGLNNRSTAILVAAVFAVLAAALIYLFMTHYRKAPAAPVVPQDATVWVASQYIPAGSPQNQIARDGLIKPTQVPVSQAVPGVLTNPSVVAGEATSVAIDAGQQVTTSDFARTPTNSITGYLKGDQRGVAFTLDAEHGLTSYLQAPDTVDVMGVDGTAGASELLAKNVTIIASTAGLVVLRLTDKQALLVTAATGKYSLWLTMRPTVKATNSVQVGAVGSVGTVR